MELQASRSPNWAATHTQNEGSHKSSTVRLRAAFTNSGNTKEPASRNITYSGSTSSHSGVFTRTRLYTPPTTGWA